MCETYSQHAYLHLSGCFYQGFRTGDDGGSGGAYVIDDEDMFALKLRDGVLALPVMIGCCGFKNLAHVFLSFLPVLVGLAFAKLFLLTASLMMVRWVSCWIPLAMRRLWL